MVSKSAYLGVVAVHGLLALGLVGVPPLERSGGGSDGGGRLLLPRLAGDVHSDLHGRVRLRLRSQMLLLLLAGSGGGIGGLLLLLLLLLVLLVLLLLLLVLLPLGRRRRAGHVQRRALRCAHAVVL